MMISDCVVGSEIRVVGINLDTRLVHRLRELGLGAGTRARVVQRAAFGGRILAILGQRIALDAGTARSIAVELIPAQVTVAMPVAVPSVTVSTVPAAA